MARRAARATTDATTSLFSRAASHAGLASGRGAAVADGPLSWPLKPKQSAEPASLDPLGAMGDGVDAGAGAGAGGGPADMAMDAGDPGKASEGVAGGAPHSVAETNQDMGDLQSLLEG